ncbi:MAG: head-tail connector protein [Limnohabitans sp.]
MNYELVEGPAALPVTAAELRRNSWEIYEADATDDTFLTELLTRATAHVETITSRKLVSQTWRGYLDTWPIGGAPIELPFGRVTLITRFNWLGDDAIDHVMTASVDYIASLAGYFPKVVPVSAWPSGSLFVVDPIRIEFVAGFGAAAAVPNDLKQAILLLAAHWYKNREIARIGNIVSPHSHVFDALVGPWRIRGV